MTPLCRLLSPLVVSVLIAVLGATRSAAQDTRSDRASPTPIRSIPENGARRVAADRSTSLFFPVALDASTITPQSIAVVAGSATVQAERSLSLNQRIVTIDYPFFLPGKTRIEVRIDGNLLRDLKGLPVDADADGEVGGVKTIRFRTGRTKTAPLGTGSAVIMGSVFDTQGNPLEGAIVRGWRFPRVEGEPPLPVQPGVTDATGFFRYTTIDFTGTETFLIVITKADHSEAIVKVEILAKACKRVRDTKLQPLAPRQMVMATTGACLTDPTGRVTLDIPPDALMQNSDISVTILESSEFLREELPELVAEGTFVDIAGVFGEETSKPVTMQIPNKYDLPVGTRVPFGKVDHNTLEWSDFRDLYTGPGPVPDSYLGTIKQRPDGSTYIEVQFDKFCSTCTPYCNPNPDPDGGPPDDDDDDDDDPGCDPNDSFNNSVVELREGFLREEVRLPLFMELGGAFGLSLGYNTRAAAPSATLQLEVDYNSVRPVERTIFRFEVEGRVVEAAYDFTSNNQKPIGTWFWNGINGLGQRMPTGSYAYTLRATSLNARVAVSLPAIFGGVAVQSFNATYPGLTPLRTDDFNGRVTIVNLRNSPFGAGWRVMEVPRLAFDADGCVLMVNGNSHVHAYLPDGDTVNGYVSPAWDESALVHNPATGGFVRSMPDGSREEFGPSGRLLSRTTRFDYETTFTWQNNRLVGVTSPTGHHFHLSYDGRGKLQTITDSAGRTTGFSVDANGDLVSITDANGATRTFVYDAEHRMIGQAGSRGERTEYVYDNGRIVETRAFDTDGTTLLRSRRFSPSVLNGEMGAALAQGLGSLLAPIPLALGRVDKMTDGTGGEFEHEADEQGRSVRYQDALGRQWYYTYDEHERSSGWRRPNGSILEFERDEHGNPTAVVHKLSASNVYATETREFGVFGLVNRLTDQEGHDTVYSHDALGRIMAERKDGGVAMTHVYGDRRFPSLATQTTDPTGRRLLYSWDEHGNLASVTRFSDPVGNPAGETIRITYDAAGWIHTVTSALGQTTTHLRDAFGRPTSIADHLGNVVLIDYDAAGCGCSTPNRTKVTLPNSATVTYEYDGLNRLTRMTDQLGNSSHFTYDAEGNRLTSLDRNGALIHYDYDAGGQLIRKRLPNGEIVEFRYDEMGALIAAADPECRLEFSHDVLGRVLSAKTILDLSVGGGAPQPFVHELTYSYDRARHRTAVTDSFGIVNLSYDYDNLHRLATVSLGNSAEQWGFSYDDEGRRTSRTVASSSAHTGYAYDGAGNVTAIAHQTVPPLALTYDYDDSGKVITRTRQNAGLVASAYSYDGIDRVTGGALSTVFGDAQVNVAYGYDAADRLQSDDEYAYTYDNEGQLIRRVANGSSLTDHYVYDAQGQLRRHVQTIDPGGGPVPVLTVDYQYDPFGRRIEKSVNGVVTRYVYDEEDLLHELDFINRVERSYVHGPGVDEPLAIIDGVTSEVLHVHQDRLGSVIGLSNATGTLVQEYTYDEHGALLDELAPDYFQPYGFTARERDPETGLTYHRARYYDARLGRFVAEDPLGVNGGFNVQAYADNNPVNLTDPTGLFPDFCIVGCDHLKRQCVMYGMDQACYDWHECERRCRKWMDCIPTRCAQPCFLPFATLRCLGQTGIDCIAGF